MKILHTEASAGWGGHEAGSNEGGELRVHLLAALKEAVRPRLQEWRHVGKRSTKPDFWQRGVHAEFLALRCARSAATSPSGSSVPSRKRRPVSSRISTASRPETL